MRRAFLFRYEGAVLAHMIAERKRLYETLHPETRLGENQRTRVRQIGEPSTGRFTAATARATGKSERSIQRVAHCRKPCGADASRASSSAEIHIFGGERG